MSAYSSLLRGEGETISNAEVFGSFPKGHYSPLRLPSHFLGYAFSGGEISTYTHRGRDISLPLMAMA